MTGRVWGRVRNTKNEILFMSKQSFSHILKTNRSNSIMFRKQNSLDIIMESVYRLRFAMPVLVKRLAVFHRADEFHHSRIILCLCDGELFWTRFRVSNAAKFARSINFTRPHCRLSFILRYLGFQVSTLRVGFFKKVAKYWSLTHTHTHEEFPEKELRVVCLVDLSFIPYFRTQKDPFSCTGTNLLSYLRKLYAPHFGPHTVHVMRDNVYVRSITPHTISVSQTEKE